ncbi:MAG: glycosyltransferase family 2 protein [Sulfolobaceae archaeon]
MITLGFLSFSIIPILLSLAIVYQIYKEQRSWRELDKRLISIKANLPFASIIVPIRGIDVRVEDHIRSLINQDYPNYEIIYVVDSFEDPIVNILKKYPIKLIKSNYNCKKCSGKIMAQISGFLESRGEVIIFADSDTIYPRHWLRYLVTFLSIYNATTVFSWPLPSKITFKNLLRAGFWTLGFESQAVGGTFLWGGSMAFKREFFSTRVISELSEEICDDCTLTRLIKESGGRIGFIWSAMPLNLFHETNLLKWASREVLMIIKHSRRGAKIFIIFVILLIINMLLSAYTFLSFIPLLLWIFKNILRGKLYLKQSILPAIFSIFAIFFGFFLLLINWNNKEIEWRGRRYILE